MLSVQMTPNLLGFMISGTYDDLDTLYDAIWNLSIADADYPDDSRMRGTFDELAMSTRLLALNYDLRHAYQGDRDVKLVPNGMDKYLADYHGLPLVECDVVYSVKVLYPEAMYELLALDYLMRKREGALGKNETAELDTTINHVRLYRSLVVAAVRKNASPGRLTRIVQQVTRGCYLVPTLYQQWVDILNNNYVFMSRKQRYESLSTIVRDLVEFGRNDQYLELVHDIDAFALQEGIDRTNARIPGLYDWDEPEW